MKVNRVYRRCHLTGKGELKTESSINNLVIHDISASGASIETDKPLELDKTYEIKITFIGQRMDIIIHPTIKITRASVTGEKFFYGISFIDLTENEKVQIDEIVNHQCALDDQTLGENCAEGGCLFSKRKRTH